VAELDAWAQRIAGWPSEVEVFAYFNNDWEGFAIRKRPDFGAAWQDEGMAKRALIVVDMLNSYDFEGADALAESAADAVPIIAGLIGRAREEGVDVIYVNDNYGHWNSSRQELVSIAKEGAHPELVEPLEPDEDIMFVVKARHSIFYQTPVEFLLSEQEIDHLVLTGQVTEQCILYSALDAYVRDLEVTVVHDAVAHIDSELGQGALELMKRNMNAEIVRARDCRLAG